MHSKVDLITHDVTPSPELAQVIESYKVPNYFHTYTTFHLAFAKHLKTHPLPTPPDDPLKTQQVLQQTKSLYPTTYAASYTKQTWILLKRHLTHYIRHPAVFWGQLVIHTMFAIMCGSIFKNLVNDTLLGSVEYNVVVLLFWNSQVIQLANDTSASPIHFFPPSFVPS